MTKSSEQGAKPVPLFTVRLWHEVHSDDSPPEWRGQITNLHNREVRYFRDLETLYSAMIKMADSPVNEEIE